MNQPEPIKETEQQIEAEAYLAQPEIGQMPRGIFYQDGYVLLSNYSHIKGRKLTGKQEERGRALTERLQALLEAKLLADGWRPVAQTKEGLPIWRPVGAQNQPVSPAPAQSALSEQETGIAADDQAGEVRKSKPIYRKTKPITFTCQWCRQEVTEQRFPPYTPLYCSNPACKKEATRVKTRERVKAYYKTHPRIRSKKKTG